MNDLRTTMTLDDYVSAFMYLQAKQEAMAKAQNPAARGAIVMN